jgi:hypothetical protein
MDFKLFSKNKKDYNVIYIIINQFNKRVYLIFYYKMIIIKNIIQFFITNVYRTHKFPKIIILNRNL